MTALELGHDGPPRPVAGTERRRREPGQDGPTCLAEERIGEDGEPSSGARPTADDMGTGGCFNAVGRGGRRGLALNGGFQGRRHLLIRFHPGWHCRGLGLAPVLCSIGTKGR